MALAVAPPAAARPQPQWPGSHHTGAAASAPRPAAVGCETTGRPQLLLAAVAAAGLLGSGRPRRQAAGPHAGARRTSRCGRWALPMAGGQGLSDSYVPVAVAQSDGTVMEIDIRLTDTVKVLKAMLALELDITEDRQELSFEGALIEEGVMLGQLGIKEGSRLELEVEEEEVDESAPAGKDCMRVTVVCDATPGKAKRLGLDVTAEETANELKIRAYEEFAKTTEAFQEGTCKDYGLFILKSPPVDAKGQLRYLRQDERLGDKKSMEENGIKGGEDIVFASLFWLGE
mmetsp:Transcript_18374/g.57622  ORF Transcript_18374/g.57622 Transcript_18374/m.57622 type:complete len:287 (+) Transcript_18374:80-940(+)